MSDQKDMICEVAAHSFYVKGFSTCSQSFFLSAGVGGVEAGQLCGLVIKTFLYIFGEQMMELI